MEHPAKGETTMKRDSAMKSINDFLNYFRRGNKKNKITKILLKINFNYLSKNNKESFKYSHTALFPIFIDKCESKTNKMERILIKNE